MSSSAASSILRIDTARIFKPLLAPARYKAAYGGRGSAKSWFFAELGVENAIRFPGYRLVCIREVQRSLKESVKRLLEDTITRLDVRGFRLLEDRIDTPGGGVITFTGMQDHTAESIKSLEGYHAAYVEEAQTLSAGSLEKLRPTIRMPGSELWFSWNPRSPDDPVDQFFRGPNPPTNAVIIRTSYKDNPWFPAELEAERLHDLKAKPDRYGHIWEGDYEPAALGAFYADEMAAMDRDNRIRTVPHYKGEKVYTWWDLGIGKTVGQSMAIGFVQYIGHEIHCIDYEEGHSQGLPFYAAMLQRKQAEFGYVYGEHVWPHDGGHQQLATGVTLEESFRRLNFKATVLGQSNIGAGIDAVRNMLSRCFFDAQRCERWIKALRNYRREFDDKLGTFKANPLHDWSSHAADMTRMGAMFSPTTWGGVDRKKMEAAYAQARKGRL